jgi:hypothetical protein
VARPAEGRRRLALCLFDAHGYRIVGLADRVPLLAGTRRPCVV